MQGLKALLWTQIARPYLKAMILCLGQFFQHELTANYLFTKIAEFQQGKVCQQLPGLVTQMNGVKH